MNAAGHGLRRGLRRVGLTAGMAALLVQLFAWALLMPAMSAPAGGIGGGIAVCTAEGMVLLDVDRPPANAELPSGQAPDHPDGHAGGGGCPLCPLIAGLHLPPPLFLVTQDSVIRHGATALPGALILAGWFLSTLQARAPPV
ncbi:DUF2946 family protein [Azospirillum sp. HJ39]|uniref:DUF2946 family protein n=1 Tax=Azospirillum sp. HJ39 TaxID=3159496 RepID=UPI0035583EDC